MPSKATAGENWPSAAVEMGMPEPSSTAPARLTRAPKMSSLVSGATVLPHHQEVGAVEGHRRYGLVVGGGGDGDARAVEDRTGPAHPRPVDVAESVPERPSCPHHQVVGAVEGHRR